MITKRNYASTESRAHKGFYMGTPTYGCHTILQGKSIWDRRPYNKKGINLFFLPWLPREQLHFNRPGMPCINWHVACPRTSEITAKNLYKNLSDTEHQHKVRKRRFNARPGRQRDSKDSVGASFVHIRPRLTDRIVRGEKKTLTRFRESQPENFA